MNILSFPDDVLIEVVSFCSWNDVLALEQTCRALHSLCQSWPRNHGLVVSAARFCSLWILMSFLFPTFGRPPLFAAKRSFLVLFLLALSWQYSSPPFRLKEWPFLDSCSNGILVWLVWALGYTSQGQHLFGMNSGQGSHKGWLLAFCTAGVHALGAAVDVNADRASGQRTIATFAGARSAAGFSTICYLLASKTVGGTTIVDFYTRLCLIISAAAVLFPLLIHMFFQVIVYLSVVSAVLWIGEKAINL